VTVQPHSQEWLRNVAIDVQPWRSDTVLTGTLMESTSTGNAGCEDEGSCSTDRIDERREEVDAWRIEFACLRVEREC
jgi:hypothetical protein